MIKRIFITLTLNALFGMQLMAQQIPSQVPATPSPAAPQQVPNLLQKKPGMSNPTRATLYSLVPGGGQIYNKSYWKVPVIYAGFGALTYSFLFYDKMYSEVRQAYIEKINGEPVSNPDYANVPEAMLYNWRESYKKYRDMSAIGMFAWYAFNLIDANVDAHLKEFDVGESLSMQVRPQYMLSPMGQYAGVNLRLRF